LPSRRREGPGQERCQRALEIGGTFSSRRSVVLSQRIAKVSRVGGRSAPARPRQSPGRPQPTLPHRQGEAEVEWVVLRRAAALPYGKSRNAPAAGLRHLLAQEAELRWAPSRSPAPPSIRAGRQAEQGSRALWGPDSEGSCEHSLRPTRSCVLPGW